MSPRKVLIVAWRELVATVVTRGFVVGVVFMPLLLAAGMVGLPSLIDSTPSQGALVILDRTGEVGPRLPGHLVLGGADDPMGDGPMPSATLTVQILAPEADVTAALERLRRGPADEDGRALALAVLTTATVHGDAPFDLFVSPNLDVLLQGEVSARIGDAVVDARLAAGGMDTSRVRSLIARPHAVSKTVTEAGAEETNEIAAVLLPGGFMLLLWISSFTAGQFLLTSLVEEKSLRVMEVLLSAVSPLELLTGKIFGQAGVGALVLAVYVSLGSGALVHAGLAGLLTAKLLALLAVFFLLSFLLIASVMAAVGSVVDDLRSAQSLLAPVLFLLTLPTMLWLPISRAPSSTFATVMSFVPPFGPFVTVLRLAGREPPSTAQIAGSIAAGTLSVVASIWAAGKVFQVGVLLYGKPPTLRAMMGFLRGR